MASDGVPPEVSRFRREYRETSIGPHYRGWLHFGFTTTGSLLAIGVAASRLHGVTALEWLTLPLGFVVANVVEYLAHKGPMHRPRAGLGFLYQRHTREHHHFFTHDAMECESSRDFKMVLFPPALLFFFLGMITAPIALMLGALFSANVGWLFVLLGASYFLTYEWLHFSYHQPSDSAIGRLGVVRALRRHHQAHHDKALMGKWNFNITFPISDRLFGTYYQNH